MATYQYRIYCVTESTFVYGYSTAPPTVCYNNPAHIVNLNGVNVTKNPVETNIPVNSVANLPFLTSLLDFHYMGTSIQTPKYINAIVNGSGNITINIQDVVNNVSVATLTAATTVVGPTSYSLTVTPANFSANPTIWEIQASTTSGAPILESIQIINY
jgi:hypothetical protein